MTRYIFRRLLLSIPILFGITLITFAIIHLTPGGFTAVRMEMNPTVSPDSINRLRVLYGLDRPWPSNMPAGYRDWRFWISADPL